MAASVVHLVDSDSHPDGLNLLALLSAKLPRETVRQTVVVSGQPRASLALADHVTVRRLHEPFRWGQLFSGRHLEPVLDAVAADLIMGWSPAATAWAGAAGGHRLVIPVLCDPADARPCARWYRSLFPDTEPPTTVCAAQQVRRRLIEHGVPPERAVVIRPGVDFAAIRAARQVGGLGPAPRPGEARDGVREALGLSGASPVLLTAPPPSRAGGHFHAVWATAMLRQIMPGIRLIIPGRSRETDRLRRLAAGSYCPEVYVFTQDRFRLPDLLAGSDLFLMPAIGDVSTVPLAWAMAAGVPVVGSAVPAVAEMLADRHNALLCKPGEPLTLAIRIRTALESPHLMRTCVETARGQAYDVFRAQACLDEFLRLIGNAAARRPLTEGIHDTALSG